jgi:hypothetical protein
MDMRQAPTAVVTAFGVVLPRRGIAMSRKAFRRTVAALCLASFAAVMPGHAFELGRRSVDRPARTASVKGFFALLLELLGDLVTEEPDTGGAMDPNGHE